MSVINDVWLIPASDRESIFEPFYRLHETENKPGSGIGLSLASSLAEYHNGSLIYTATSTNENCFTLLLPLKQANAIAMTQAQCANSASNPIVTNGEKNKPLILIVEDHPEMRAFIRQELLAIYQVQEASNGKEALELLTNQPADLIISDIRMPIMDGFELCNQLKNNLHFSHIPLILLTAQHNFQSRLEGLNQGADAYMEKPFSVDLLLAQVANLLRNRETIYNRFSQKPLEPIQTLSASPIDDQFLEKLNQYLESALQDESLSVEQLAQAMHMSTSSLYRKVKGIAGVSPRSEERRCGNAGRPCFSARRSPYH